MEHRATRRSGRPARTEAGRREPVRAYDTRGSRSMDARPLRSVPCRDRPARQPWRRRGRRRRRQVAALGRTGSAWPVGRQAGPAARSLV